MDEFLLAKQELASELDALQNIDRTAEIEAETARFKAELTARYDAEKNAQIAEKQIEIKMLDRIIVRIQSKQQQQPETTSEA